MKGDLEIYPLTAARWDDLATLFGKAGAMMGCWCMFWRLTSAGFNATTGQEHRQAFHALVEGGSVPGLLAEGLSATLTRRLARVILVCAPLK
jgi:hypothetical protein